MTSDVLVRIEGGAGVFSLNRPQAIHALTHGMVLAMTEALRAWQSDPAVQVVLIDHAEGRGFCSGGDIALLRESLITDGGAAGRRFFLDEYRLNHLIKTYPKPVIAFIDGITMGGGVGISAPARLRIATENTRFAMPETGIGLFPDVGGGWYLSRLAGRLGQYLALTGARLDGAECLWAGLATHYLPAAALAGVKAALGSVPGSAEAILAAGAVTPPEPRLAAHAAEIARLFAADRLEDVLAALGAEASDFARQTLAAVAGKSPQSCKVALRQLATGATLPDFAAVMAMEYRVVGRLLVAPDFAEGVRALIVDKDNAPRWTPASPAEVSNASLDVIFAPLPAAQEWTPL